MRTETEPIPGKSAQGVQAMQMTLKEIADFVGGELTGESDVVIVGVNGIKEAQDGDITFVANSRYIPLLETTRASAALVPPSVNNGRIPLIRCNNPYVSFIDLMGLCETEQACRPAGIHATAIVGDHVRLGDNAAIGAYAVIEDSVSIGDNAIIYPHVYVGMLSSIGDSTIVYPHVTIRERVRIGDRVIIHSGTRIGCDGFGFAPMKGVHHKVPQIGMVIVNDDVEIGANVTIDRATFQATVIGKGTKIDNLVQIAHNVTTGEHCIIVAQTGISGSTTLGNNVTIAGQSGVVGHITLGDNVKVGAKSGVSKSCPPNTSLSGIPARPHEREKKVQASMRRLPELQKRVRALEKRIIELEEKLDG